MTHDPKTMLELADEIAQYTYDGWISLKASDSATIVAALRSAAAHQSAPESRTTHNSGEGLPNSDAASAGAGTDTELLDLPLFWRCRAQALRILDSKRDQPDEATLETAKTYDECADELKAALLAPPRHRSRQSCGKL